MTSLLLNPTGPFKSHVPELCCNYHWWHFLPWHFLFLGSGDSLARPPHPLFSSHLSGLSFSFIFMGQSSISFPFTVNFPTGSSLSPLLSLPYTYPLGNIFHSHDFKLLLLYDFQIYSSRFQLWIYRPNFVLVIFTKFPMSTSNSTRPKLNSSTSPKLLIKKFLVTVARPPIHDKNLNYPRQLPHSTPKSN